jgi:HAD superfamily hydrolase (TIGR01490 family)
MNTAVFFDLDKTISAVPTEKYFALHLFRKGIIRFKDLAQIVWETLKYDLYITRDFGRIKRTLIRIIMKNQDAGRMKAVYKEYFDNYLKSRIFPDMVQEIAVHKANNRKLVIISASLDFIVEEYCRYFGMDAFYAARLQIENNTFTGETLGRIYMGRTKHEAVQDFAVLHSIDLDKSYAYGDYIEDSHMLCLVGNPVAVNPDKKLLELASQNQWLVKNCVCAP